MGILGQALGQNGARRGVWVATVGRKLVGYIVARARCDGMVWDVEHLHSGEPAAAIELLDHVCARAAEAGGRRIFLEVPAGSEGIVPARRVGFERYAATTVFRLSPPVLLDKSTAFAARPRLRADEHQLFQLYNAAVPAPVRAAEAMTYEEWSALHRGNKRWKPSLLGDRHQFVWDLGAGLLGWMEVVYGQRSQFLEFLVEPHYENMLDRMMRYALTQVSEKAPVYATARDYQSQLATALERAAFVPAGEVEVLVRQLAARVPEPKLVPAKLVGS